ncbi:MAG TPA: hypothetical protein VFC78_14220 [Tepidisphaeraceae bacterium]|nr:hypothetical protein [Tepidisphaeraceae bacterium]
MSSSLQEWLDQGELLYQNALREFHALESQLDAVGQQLSARQAEVNQIAAIIGKPKVEAARAAPTPVITSIAAAPVIEERLCAPTFTNNANIARALAGRFGR